ncbi:MAG: Uma2 family endonuclease [Candidatus Tectimicrobiota bacterium]
MSTVWVRRWSRKDYDVMIEAGLFPPGTHAELLDGVILEMSPQKSLHATAIRLAEEALREAFGQGYDIRVQLPLALDPDSEPEPDVAVVPGSPRDYRAAHPASAVLIVEVSDTTLTYDRERKGSLYARAGITEYWLVNIPAQRLEMYRRPGLQAEAYYGWGYEAAHYATAEAHVSPLAAPQARVAVVDLLP